MRLSFFGPYLSAMGFFIFGLIFVAPPAQAAMRLLMAAKSTVLKKHSNGPKTRWVDAETIPSGYAVTVDESVKDPKWYAIILPNGQKRFAHRTDLQEISDPRIALNIQVAKANAAVAPRTVCPPRSVPLPTSVAEGAARTERRPARQIRASQECIKFLQQFESTQRDANGRMKIHHVNGNYVIGWGHEFTSASEKALYANGLSDEEADGLMKADLAKFEKIIHDYLGDVPLSQNEFDALVSMTYNTGDRFRENPTFYKLLLPPSTHETPAQIDDRYRRAFNGILSYNKVRVERRTAEGGKGKALEVWKGIQVRRAGELFLATHGRAPQKSSGDDMAEMQRLYNAGIGHTGVAAHDTAARRRELWR